MNKFKIYAILAAIMAIPAIINGLRVIKGGGNPEQIVLMWLVWYNVIIAFVTLAAAALLWREDVWGKRLAAIIFLGHLVVLLILGIILATNGNVAVKSIIAMAVRAFTFGTILFLVRK